MQEQRILAPRSLLQPATPLYFQYKRSLMFNLLACCVMSSTSLGSVTAGYNNCQLRPFSLALCESITLILKFIKSRKGSVEKNQIHVVETITYTTYNTLSTFPFFFNHEQNRVSTRKLGKVSAPYGTQKCFWRNSISYWIQFVRSRESWNPLMVHGNPGLILSDSDTRLIAD